MVAARHSLLNLVCALTLAGTLGTTARAVEFAGGTGTLNDPYQIATARQLLDIGTNSQFLTQCFVLNNDIDFDSYYGPEGHLTQPAIVANEQGPAFEGWLDGRGHVIRHLRIATNSGNNRGLIGRVGPKGMILDLGVEDSMVTSPSNRVGLLAGSSSGTLLGCWAQGRVQGYADVGLLVGVQEGGTIAYSRSEGTVAGQQQLGGLIGLVSAGEVLECSSDCRFEALPGEILKCGGLMGELTRGTVEDCFTRVDLALQGHIMGGLVGNNRAGTIRRCLSLGRLVGKSNIGGLVGGNDGTIRSCYSLCDVQADSGGGLVCDNGGAVMLCYAAGPVKASRAGGLIYTGHGAFLSYWDIEKSGVLTSAGGFGRTTAQMQQATTFRGWGREGEWLLPEGDRPRLCWEACWGAELRDESTQFSGGSGTTADPYQIQTAAEWASLAWDAGLLDKHFVLTQDINLAAVDPNGWLPIGTGGVPFCGSLDGRRHVVSGLACDLPINDTGLFGCVGTARDDPNRIGCVKNLIVRDAQVSGRDVVGALTACLDGGRIERCLVTGQVQGAGTVGGVVGEGGNNGEVRECAFAGHVSGQRRVGGLAGTYSGVLWSCYSAGEVRGDGDIIGGLVGSLGEPYDPVVRRLIAFCYSEARVTGGTYVGGLIGRADHGEVLACYATGEVSGNSSTRGGLAGAAGSMVTWGNFWDRESTYASQSAFGELQTTAAMRDARTFIGWEYGGQWTMPTGDYPRLAWEERVGPLLTDPPRAYGGGTGKYSDPYVISHSEHLVTLSRYPQDWGKHFRLSRDLDLTDVQASLPPIGTLTVPFTGSFDGNGRTLRNLKHADAAAVYVGLFRSIGRSADSDSTLSGLVSNLHLRGASVLGAEYVGTLAGHNEGEILFCTVTESTSQADQNAGGLVGHNGMAGGLLACASDAVITLGGVSQWGQYFENGGGLVAVNEGQLMLCSSAGQVRGRRDVASVDKAQWTSANVGGLVGLNQGGTLTGCTSTAPVTGSQWVGGLVGLNELGWFYRCGATGNVDSVGWAGGLLARSTGGTIAACSARGSVLSRYAAGGFMGSSHKDDIESCCFEGSVSGPRIGGFACTVLEATRIRDGYCAAAIAGTSKAGALIRELDSSVQLSNCFWDKTVFPENRAIRPGSEVQKAAVTGLDTQSLQSGDPLRQAGWDFTETWVQCAGRYPWLWWEQGRCATQP